MPGEEYYIRILFDQTSADQIMQKSIVTLFEDDDLSVAQELFIERAISHIPVIDRDNIIQGLLSQKYLYKTLSPRKIIGGEELIHDPDVLVEHESLRPGSPLAAEGREPRDLGGAADAHVVDPAQRLFLLFDVALPACQLGDQTQRLGAPTGQAGLVGCAPREPPRQGLVAAFAHFDATALQ